MAHPDRGLQSSSSEMFFGGARHLVDEKRIVAISQEISGRNNKLVITIWHQRDVDQDKILANEMKALFEKMGFSVKFPEDVGMFGMTHKAIGREAARDCSLFIPIVSDEGMRLGRGSHGYFEAISAAGDMGAYLLDKDVYMIPVTRESAGLPRMISSWKAIDVNEQGFVEKLLSSVELRMDQDWGLASDLMKR